MFEKINLIATCAFGLESEVSYELRQLGYVNQQTQAGRVMFEGDFAAMARANMWLRTAERVRWCIGEFAAASFEELYDGIRALPWGDIMEENAMFPVDGNSVRSQLTSVPAIQRIAKKAVVDAMAGKYGMSQLPEDGEPYRIRVSLLDNLATVALDTSGVGLHKRGYRSLAHEAPMKETLAASMIRFSRWKGDRVLVDPFCGSGTILIEGALMARNIAPGLKRSFAGEKWRIVPSNVWDDARTEASDLAVRSRKLEIKGSDISLSAIELASHHAREMGVDDCISFSRMDVAEFLSPHSNGVIICNPPYGERVGDLEEAADNIRVLGSIFNRHRDWSLYIISPEERFEMYFGKPASKRRKLYNGRIKCNLYQYFGVSIREKALPKKDKLAILPKAATGSADIRRKKQIQELLLNLRKIPIQKLKRLDIPADAKKQLFAYMTARDESIIKVLGEELSEILFSVEYSIFIELLENAKVPHESVPSKVEKEKEPHVHGEPHKGGKPIDEEQGSHMHLERWRDGLIDGHASFFQVVMEAFPDADRARLEKLAAASRVEIEKDSPPRNKRKLFRYLRSLERG
jgi:putative N6-adenine-specific DNA methylase